MTGKLTEALSEVFPAADWQRCAVHLYRNVFSHVPNATVREVAAMVKAIHVQENREAASAKSVDVVNTLRGGGLRKAAERVESSVVETLRTTATRRSTD